MSITKADPNALKSEDLVRHDFSANAPGIKVSTNITQINCSDGKLYFCGVPDAFDGAEIGYSIANHMRAELITLHRHSRWLFAQQKQDSSKYVYYLVFL